MSELHASIDFDLHRTYYHAMPMDAGREQVIDRRSYRTAAEAAGTYCTHVQYQQLPAIEPGDLLYTELVYAGRLATAQWWTADSAGLRKITEDRMLSMLGDQLTSDTETFLRLT